MNRIPMNELRGILRAYIKVGGELIWTHAEGSRRFSDIWQSTIASLYIIEVAHHIDGIRSGDFYLIAQSGVRAEEIGNPALYRLFITDCEIYPTLDAAVMAAMLQTSHTV